MRFAFLLLLLLLAHAARAQTLPARIDSSTASSVVQRLIVGLDEYVDLERAHELKVSLQEHLSAYEAITDPHALADRLTSDMRAQVHDKHLTVLYSDLSREGEGPADPASKERMHRVEEASGLGIRTVARLPGNIGLLDLAYFSDDPEAAAALDGAMAILHGSDALIIDLRRNRGGNPVMVDRLLTYLFAGQVQLTSIVWRDRGKDRVDEQWTLVYVPGARIPETPVYVLVSDKTISAGEQCAYDLQALHRATLFGQTTAGGANPGGTQPLGAHFEAFIPTGRAVSPVTKSNWEGIGVQPDIQVTAGNALLAAYTRALQSVHPSVTATHLERGRLSAIADPARALRDAGFAPN